ncbi:MAG: hypothetical protein R2795_27460 [Saprospiraceae bacterium]
MISVPNRLPLLNGNSNNPRIQMLLLAVSLMATLSACELFKPLPSSDGNKPSTADVLDPIQGKRVYDPATGTYVLVQNSPSDPMDTVIWKDIPSSVEPPIYSTSAPVAPYRAEPSEAYRCWRRQLSVAFFLQRSGYFTLLDRSLQ